RTGGGSASGASAVARDSRSDAGGGGGADAGSARRRRLLGSAAMATQEGDEVMAKDSHTIPVPEKVPEQAAPIIEQNMPIVAVDMPILYEDEGQEEMGDSHPHSVTIDNIKPGLIAHLARQPQYRVYSDINTYY